MDGMNGATITSLRPRRISAGQRDDLEARAIALARQHGGGDLSVVATGVVAEGGTAPWPITARRCARRHGAQRTRSWANSMWSRAIRSCRRTSMF